LFRSNVNTYANGKTVTTVTFDENAGKTLLVVHDRYPSKEALDSGSTGAMSRSRITQILNLLNLAPDLQERLLFLEPNPIGRDPIYEPALRRLSQIEDWEEQRRQFELLLACERTQGNGGAACLNKP
jgi:hypothetical protein